MSGKMLRTAWFVLITVAAALAFAAIWTHGSELPRRLAGSAGLAAGLAVIARVAGSDVDDL